MAFFETRTETKLKQVIHNRPILILGIAESISGIGNWITAMAVLALVIFRGDGTVAQSSGIFLAALLPSLLFSPLAGSLADRVDRKWLMMASEFLAGLTVLGLIFARPIELTYFLLALEATFGTLMLPARQAAIVDLVDQDDLTRANALLGQLSGIIKIGAPILAGMLLLVLAPQTAMVLDVISFGFSVAILSRLPALPPHKSGRATLAANAQASPLTALRGSPQLSLLFAVAFLVTCVIMGFDVLASVFTRDVLAGNEGLFGLLIGLIGVGTVVATTGLLIIKGKPNPWRDTLVGLALLATIPGFLMLATLSPTLLWAQLLAVVGCLIGGVGNGLIVVQSGTLLQLLAPPELLGRLGGLLQSTFVAGQLFAIFATPFLVPERLAIGAYFGIAAVALLLIAAGSVLILRRGSTTPLRTTTGWS